MQLLHGGRLSLTRVPLGFGASDSNHLAFHQLKSPICDVDVVD